MGVFRLAASKRKSAMSSLAALCSGVAIGYAEKQKGCHKARKMFSAKPTIRIL